ncbi:mitofissin KNAG_0L02210 [Huiozyma naganishii CBS 8797]|uniref:DUF1748-domain-containing protein n=1 Tax=Huiozyma naganishii (strain ATCC MYA-139 / BCRC 22969 / CBS 8797 / KCTC 17520 / NBRC 10181 / NCYC 3082 / Yp74L-3) TaxID=1071383 RepID=J7RSE0_HUIN7|nr:hypothetical protein KNAG_0L02210 [Kazachstania naganishii CBS 8797]CCK72838.1 hypothetical protein KNAG_0L02210 [Kazachstania naganishii CBS 8797]
MAIIGKVVHCGVDLLLVSACLAGIKRNTGLTVNVDRWENAEAKKYTRKYLNVGESLYDYAVASMASSKYCKRE